MNAHTYSSTEARKSLSVSPPRVVDTAFAVAAPSLPRDARPIIDDQSGACVGFIHEGAKNVWHIFDVSGQCVAIEEAPLETPLIDPYDLILIGSAALKLMRTGFSAASRLATGRAAVSATSKITSRVLPLLRSRLRSLSVTRLQFTETTAKHMANPGRFVPVHILHLAIKYGARMPDPQKVAGVFRYEIPMSRFVKRGTTYIRERKTLEIVVRESDWTILHFMYY
ncbi:hypothetical protein [Burkholderia ambifaria]|uniref:hypothetical protein n=1 Tax=Burkholderia ambifaria TaxID=152480 RepID=UPI001B9706EE|nr:hypothetical protein [Burkholderia ambifaria]MBR8178453.1 hypothetical protein [Burkholderia ambifaria]